MYTSILQRDLQRLDLSNLYKLQEEAQQDLTESKGSQYQEIWEFLTLINKWIRKDKVNEEYIKGRKVNRNKDINHCGYDDVLNEELL